MAPTDPVSGSDPATLPNIPGLTEALDRLPVREGLTVSFDDDLPSDAALASFGVPADAIAALHSIAAHRDQLAARLIDEPGYAHALAADPRTTLGAAGLALPGASPADTPTRFEVAKPVATKAAGTRVRTRITPASRPGRVTPGPVIGRGTGPKGPVVGPDIPQLTVAPDELSRQLIGSAVAMASASGASWASFCANPEPTVRQAAASFDWRLLKGGSGASASVIAQAIDALRTTLHLVPMTTNPGQPGGPGTPTTTPTGLGV